MVTSINPLGTKQALYYIKYLHQFQTDAVNAAEMKVLYFASGGHVQGSRSIGGKSMTKAVFTLPLEFKPAQFLILPSSTRLFEATHGSNP